jgi:FkbM family methyltransferase
MNLVAAGKKWLSIVIAGTQLEFFLRTNFDRVVYLKSNLLFLRNRGQVYDSHTIRISKIALQGGFDWIDAGAHTGGLARLIKKATPNSTGYAFEPIPNIFKIIEQRIPSISVNQIALSNFCGESSFEYLVDDPANSSLFHRPERIKNKIVKEIVVSVQRIDCFFQDMNHSVRFMKIDTEGNEYNILEGSKDLVLTDRPIIVFESTNKDLPRIYDWFENISYTVDFTHNYPGKQLLDRNSFLKLSASEGEYFFVAYPISE